MHLPEVELDHKSDAIGVGAQSTLGGHKIFARKNMYQKSAKCPNFTRFLPEKLSKYPNFYYICPKNLQNSRILHDFCPNNARILHNNCPKKIFFPNFRGARAPLPPRLLRLCPTP